MRPVIVLALTVAALLSACAGSDTPRTPQPAPVVHPAGATGAQLLPAGYVCQDCAMDFIVTAIRPPAHGLMLARGGFMTPQSLWLVVDYDSGRITRVVTAASRDAAGNFTLQRVAQEGAALSEGQLRGIRSDADAIWGALHTMRSTSSTDMTWSLYLIDGRAVRHEFGIGLPGEDAAKLADTLDNVVRQQFGR
ncbi:hypothetical protein [Burkholderia sp. 3C]